MTIVSPTLQRWREVFSELEEVCPWPGPRPLREEDASLLCGRAEDSAAFRREVDTHRLVLLTGESGVGKTSLLRAGLVPTLRAMGYLVAVCREWTGSAENTDSLAFLARMVRRDFEGLGVEGLAAGPELFWQLHERFGDRAVLVLDQFEELIRDARDFKDDLFDVLAELNEQTAIKVIISFRSEYLHELRPLESRARPFTISHYFLKEVDPRNARELVEAGNSEGRLAIDSAAVKEVVENWTDAVKRRSTTAGGRERVGLLHLQALLYALEDAAGHATVTADTLEDFRLGRPSRDDSDMFWGALSAAVEVKLARCRTASKTIGLDPYLIEGTAHVLAQSVRHLSSAGYKLVRESWDLANATLGEEFESLRLGIRRCREHPSAEPDDKVSDKQQRALFDILVASIQFRQGSGTSDLDHPDAGTAQPTLDLLTADRKAIALRADAAHTRPHRLRWVKRLHESGDPVSLDAESVTCGPMLGMSPASVLIEEMRRFAFALEWLQASSLVRLNTPLTGGVMVALIHDGFGAALDRWAKAPIKDPAGALHALTAPRAAEFNWTFEPPGVTPVEVLRAVDLGSAFVPELDGEAPGDAEAAAPGEKLLVNLRWRGAVVRAGFRRVAFVNCDLRGTIFRRCVFDGARFVNCVLDGVIFSDCVIVGKPGAADVSWSPEAPTYSIRVRDDLPAVIARYRDLEPGATTLFAQLAGLPAIPSVDEGESILLDMEPGGLVVYGSRLFSLVMRRCSFSQDGIVRLRDTVGSGFDVVEIESGGRYEIVGSRLRHVTFTSSSTGSPPGSQDDLKISITGSAINQLWLGDNLHGTLDANDCQLVQAWNGAALVTAWARERSTFHGLVNIRADDTCVPLVESERSLALENVDPKGTVASVSSGMDYQRISSAFSRKV